MKLAKIFAAAAISAVLVLGSIAGAFADMQSDVVIANGVLLSAPGAEGDFVVPDNVYKIGDKAFFNNTSLTSVTIPKSVSVIGKEAFFGCTSLSEVSSGEGVASVGESAFKDTPWFLSFQNSICTLGCVAIGANSDIYELKLPDNITAIAPRAFSEKESLYSADLSNITDIGDYSFDGCLNLSDIKFSDNIKYIGVNAFDGTMYLEDKQDDFVTVGSILVKYKGEGGSVTVPDSVTQIAGGAFAGNESVASVTLGESVYYIGKNAFTSCPLVKISIPQSVTYIGDEAFSFCPNLGSVELPGGELHLGSGAFYKCSSLKSVNLGGADEIETITFAGCTSLSSVTMGSSTKSIAPYAFANCNALHKLNIPQSVASIGENAFAGCPSLTIQAVLDSTAYKYALENSIPVEQASNPAEREQGDVDGDGRVSMHDVTLMQRFIAGLESLDKADIEAGDFTNDSKLSMEDVTTLQRKIAGLL